MMTINKNKRGRPAVHGIQGLERGQIYAVENGSVRNIKRLARYHAERLGTDYLVSVVTNIPTLIGVVRIK